MLNVLAQSLHQLHDTQERIRIDRPQAERHLCGNESYFSAYKLAAQAKQGN